MKKVKNILNIVVFAVIIFFLSIASIITEDSEISFSERRKLAQMPKFTVGNIMNGEFSKGLEEYMSDQFAFRDSFRLLNYNIRANIMNQSDVNDLYVYQGGIYKIVYPIDEKQIDIASAKITEIQNKYLDEANSVYISIIPDKAYYNGNENTLKLSHETLVDILLSDLDNVAYINMDNVLSIDDYYFTDIHWKQENLAECANALLSGMGKSERADISDYRKVTYPDFVGGYAAQIGINSTEDLTYLTNENLESCSVYDLAENKKISMYNENALGLLDSYDVFLYGAKPLIKINNPNSETNDRLIIFRDSFGSSITPLLTESYSEIILVDLRYIKTDLLSEYVDFENADVLFLYSDSLVNGASILK